MPFTSIANIPAECRTQWTDDDYREVQDTILSYANLSPAVKLCRPQVTDWAHLIASGLFDETNRMVAIPLQSGQQAFAHLDHPGWVGYATHLEANHYRLYWYDQRAPADRQYAFHDQSQDYWL